MEFLSPFRNSFCVNTHNSCIDNITENLENDKVLEVNENNNQININGNKIQEVWNKHTFVPNKVDHHLDLENVNMSWAAEPTDKTKYEMDIEELEEQKPEFKPRVEEKEETPISPSHHARRPMNAFLIFCKKHRPVVRERYPNLENRGVTKILGEWWSLLDESEKMPFTHLANEHKDAFLSANPDFKWYKLPAPPLRSLNMRPNITTKLPSPYASPTYITTAQTEFTPGKLADESQLGSLTSLLNNNFILPNKTDACCKVEVECKNEEEEKNNNMTNTKNVDVPSSNFLKMEKSYEVPPKPIKKRIFLQYMEKNLGNEDQPRNSLKSEDSNSESGLKPSDITNQELVNKVVDKIFINNEKSYYKNILHNKDLRKSGRQCKGKRYQKFMVEGKLLGNKKEAKLTQQKFPGISNLFDKELTEKLDHKPTPKLDLGDTIKRLAERTKIKNDPENPDILFYTQNQETSSVSTDNLENNNFNLDTRITKLPSLSYDIFIQRKKDSKKRKFHVRSLCEQKVGVKAKPVEELVGSKKRKNKQSITHLGKKDDATFSNDLIGLATLAEVAASTEKLL